MEEGQRHFGGGAKDQVSFGLNPCCNGRGSKTQPVAEGTEKKFTVLILVVMEEGQRLHREGNASSVVRECLNPCCNGRGSKTMRTS